MNSQISRKQELETKIADLEDSLSALKQQLKRQEEDVQHEAIDNLEFYLEQVDHKYKNFRSFWSIIAGELRDLFKGSSDNGPTDRG